MASSISRPENQVTANPRRAHEDCARQIESVFYLTRIFKNRTTGEEEMMDQRTAPWAVLLLRVSLGALFIAHLYWKFVLLDGGLDKWWANFAAQGYPAITPWYCISAEFAGALLLIPGIWARW